MVSDCASSKCYRANAMAMKKAAACSVSNGKSQASNSKKIHKAEREKLKRDHLNDLFQELSRDLDPLGQSNCKASILVDAIRAFRHILAQLEKLRQEHDALVSESRYITVERDELKDEKLALESDIWMLQKEVNQRLRCSEDEDDAWLTLAQPTGIPDSSQQHHHPALQSHGGTGPASLLQRPQARYPSPSDSWPAKLLSDIPRALQEQEQKQDPQLCCASSSTLTSCGSGGGGGGGEELATGIIQNDYNNAKLG